LAAQIKVWSQQTLKRSTVTDSKFNSDNDGGQAYIFSSKSKVIPTHMNDINKVII